MGLCFRSPPSERWGQGWPDVTLLWQPRWALGPSCLRGGLSTWPALVSSFAPWGESRVWSASRGRGGRRGLAERLPRTGQAWVRSPPNLAVTLFQRRGGLPTIAVEAGVQPRCRSPLPPLSSQGSSICVTDTPGTPSNRGCRLSKPKTSPPSTALPQHWGSPPSYFPRGEGVRGRGGQGARGCGITSILLPALSHGADEGSSSPEGLRDLGRGRTASQGRQGDPKACSFILSVTEHLLYSSLCVERWVHSGAHRGAPGCSGLTPAGAGEG